MASRNTTISSKNTAFLDVVNEKSDNLEADNEWRSLYNKRADNVSKGLEVSDYKNRGSLDKLKELIKVSKELQIYSCYSLVKDSTERTARYDLRFRGQKVCEVRINSKKEITLRIKDKEIQHNKEYFGVEVEGIEAKKDYPIESTPASDFLSKFKDVPIRDNEGEFKVRSPEHMLESLALRSMAGSSDGGKIECFKNIQPIKFGNGFFQMPTQGGGSKPEGNKYGKGSIDILARFLKKSVGPNYAVIEVKDEMPDKYDVNRVMEQALKYATFIAYLLADENCGKKWFNIFRDQGNDKELRNSLEILVMTMMPSMSNEKDNPPLENDEPITLEFKDMDRSKDMKIKLIPCTCFLRVDSNFTMIKDAYGTYREHIRPSTPKTKKH